MKLTEYQAKRLIAQRGVAVPEGKVAITSEEICGIAEGIGYPVVLKAQVTFGGRGKAGGIVRAADERELRRAADAMLGMNLQTAQTGENGCRVEQVLVEKALEHDKELYVSLTVDRNRAGIILMASKRGGVDIEQALADDPEHLCTIFINPLLGLRAFHLRRICFHLELAGEVAASFSELLIGLYELMTRNDLLLLEINPLALDERGGFTALDAKIEIDDNGLFRFPLKEQLEKECTPFGANYVKLGGVVGTMANGAGLAMATIDMVDRLGLSAANFLDVGGGADSRSIAQCLSLVLANQRVKILFINIFGGILRCDLFAAAMVKAARELNLAVPVVVRMEGLNRDAGVEILRNSEFPISFVADLSQAAERLTDMAVRI
ncbi:MAG: ADP-forming succinate--CoA ligase subunit beta [Desulfobulbaceae bacterium]|nr:ADP-forming succinate--CoA ligase subunit beta [Desulfobulbaceae bacterium]